MEKWGILKITKDKKTDRNHYKFFGKNIHIGKHKFPDGYRKGTICLKINNRWFGCEPWS